MVGIDMSKFIKEAQEYADRLMFSGQYLAFEIVDDLIQGYKHSIDDIQQLEQDKAELLEALEEARWQVIELCTTRSIPLPYASLSRYDSLINKYRS